MLDLNKVTLRNFMSVGNVTQTVELDREGLTLILGENVDLGGTNARNGVGKSSLLHAISFGLYGVPVSSIKKDNLVNSTNQKNMVVTIEFSREGKNYRIERGRKPAFMRYYIDDGLVSDPEDESQGDSRNTQEEITRVLGLSHQLFCHIVAMNTITAPFLILRPGEQREIIEELLGITVISARSEVLKEIIKNTKESIKEEEMRNKALVESNIRIHRTIEDLKRKRDDWDTRQQAKTNEAVILLEELTKVDAEEEVANHEKLEMFKVLTAELSKTQKDRDRNERDLVRISGSYDRLLLQIEATENHQCHECGQKLHSEQHQETLNRLVTELTEVEKTMIALGVEIESQDAAIKEYEVALSGLGKKPTTVYGTLKEAMSHKSMVEAIREEVNRETNAANPYEDQITTLEQTGLQEVDTKAIDELNVVLKHQELLHKLLTNKDSFIRKKIIDQNINHLNHRLNFYLEKLNLPHEVVFKSDLSVDITLAGRDFDYAQLSRGEGTRVNLAISWSFRDVFENLCSPVNLLIIDEFLDNGIDPQGSELSLDLMKVMARERLRNIYLISHKEEIVARVNKILKVTKENGFTSFAFNDTTD